MKLKNLLNKLILLFVSITVISTGCAQVTLPKDFHLREGQGIQQESATTIQAVPDTFETENKLIWDRINNEIVNAKTRVIIINWAGYGGYVYMMEQTADAIDSAKAHGHVVILNLVGPSYSCHADILCHASLIFWNGNYAGFHSVFTVDENGNKIFSDDTSAMAICLAKGILTDDNLRTMIHDRMMIIVFEFKTIIVPDQKSI